MTPEPPAYRAGVAPSNPKDCPDQKMLCILRVGEAQLVGVFVIGIDSRIIYDIIHSMHHYLDVAGQNN